MRYRNIDSAPNEAENNFTLYQEFSKNVPTPRQVISIHICRCIYFCHGWVPLKSPGVNKEEGFTTFCLGVST